MTTISRLQIAHRSARTVTSVYGLYRIPPANALDHAPLVVKWCRDMGVSKLDGVCDESEERDKGLNEHVKSSECMCWRGERIRVRVIVLSVVGVAVERGRKERGALGSG